MRRYLGILAVLIAMLPVAILPAAVSAHGPSRQKVVDTIEINAPADKVWAVVSNYKDFTWHPEIAKSEAGDGMVPEKTMRTLTFKKGGVVTDKLMAFDPERKYISFMTAEVDLKMLPVSGYSSYFTVTPDGDKTKLEWKGAFYRGYVNNNPPPELSDKAAVDAVTVFQRAGLEALKAKIESGS
jgi:hypothetical protein